MTGAAPPTPLERALRPGEEVRFEARARGWAHLEPIVLVPYSMILALAAFQDLWSAPLVAGQIGRFTLALPFQAFALGFIFMSELYRLAIFRSRLYVVTNQRVLRFWGVFRFGLKRATDVGALTGVQLRAGTPTLLRDRERISLVGLDAVDQESIAAALPGVSVLDHMPAGLLHRRASLLAVLVACVFVGLVQVGAFLERRAKAGFQRRWAAVSAAVAAAEGATKKELEAQGLTVRSYSRANLMSLPFVNVAFVDVNLEAHDAQYRGLRMFRVHIEAQQTFDLAPVLVPVVVSQSGGDPEANAVLLAELREAFAASGIEATWPR